MGRSRARWLLAAATFAAIGGLLWWLTREPPSPAASRPLGRAGSPVENVPPRTPDDSDGDDAAIQRAPDAGREPVRLALDPAPPSGRRVAGRVVRASDGTPLGKPVPFGFDTTSQDPSVTDALGAFLAGRTWSTDPDGRFAVAGVPDAVDVLRFPDAHGIADVGAGGETDGEAPKHAVSHSIPGGPDDALDLEIRLATGWALTGVVTRTDGAALIDAEVDFDGFSTRTREGGRFVLYDVLLPAEQTKLWCRATAPWHAPGTAELLVPDGDVVVGPIRIELSPGGALEGRVTDAAGAPLPDVAIGVIGEARGYFTLWDRWVRRGHSDADGRFQVDGVPAGRLIVSARRPEGIERWYGDVLVRAGETTWLDVDFPAGSLVTGRVTDTGGRPVAGVGIRLERIVRWNADASDRGGDVSVEVPGGRERPSHRHWVVDPATRERTMWRERRQREADATTDDQGIWTIEGSFPGLKRLSTTSTPTGLLPADPRDLDVPDDGVPVVADIVLATGGTLAGTVHDRGGQPVEGFEIEAWIGEDRVPARSDADGRFELVGLPDERVYLDGDHPDYRSWSGWALAGDAPLALVLERRQTLHVEVVDAQTGAPIPRYLMIMNAQGASVLFTVESADGRFDRLVDGGDPRELRIDTDGYATWSSESVRAADTSVERPLTVRLTRDV